MTALSTSDSWLLKPNPVYKPFRYPWAFTYWELQSKLHWMPEEVPMGPDVQDYKHNLTPAEKSLLTHIFRFFTQSDVEVGKCYIEKYSKVFQPTEVRMMLQVFSYFETIHIAAYSHLLDTLGLPEVEYQAFLKYKEMKDKFDYLQQFEVDSLEGVARTMAVFAAFTEGLQLFASFAILLNFPRFNKMKGMGQIVTWSVRDETIHCEGMINLFRQFIKEHPHIWTDEFRRTLYQACRDIVEHEDAFIDLAFEMGGVEGLTADEVKQYIRYIADRRLMQLGLKPNYNVQENPLPWIDEMLNATEHTNFFEQRATEYSKAATKGTWEEVFPDPISENEGKTVYQVYSKDGCPQCVAAKTLLTNKGQEFEVVDLTTDERGRMDLYEETKLRTMPVIFKREGNGERKVVGGYLDLRKDLGV